MRQLIAGNWKMNCLCGEAEALAQAVAAGAGDITAELLVCPTALHLSSVAQTLKGSPVAVGGQNCHHEPKGAHTGDISAPMLADVGATWVILGHSERRQNHGETDEMVREKTLAAVAAGLTPIVCVGETEEQRAATEADVAMMHAFIREELVRQFGEAGRGIRILYGGSVRPSNAAGLLAVPDVAGALVGGASLNAADFLAIARAAQAG